MRLVRRRRRHIRPGFESGICPAQRRGGALDGGNLTLEVLTIGSGEQSRIVGDSSRRHSPDRVACGAFGWDKVRTLVRHDMHLHLPIFPRRQAQGSRYSSLANLNVAIDPSYLSKARRKPRVRITAVARRRLSSCLHRGRRIVRQASRRIFADGYIDTNRSCRDRCAGAVDHRHYNGLVSMRQRVSQAFADIDVQLRQRHDLIPNLVETVKGYAAHERGTLEAVIQARNAAMTAQGPQAQAAAEQQLSGTLGRLIALSESYPDLKANANFQQLQAQLTDIENKIAAARRFFNNAVSEYNAGIQRFPAALFAASLGFAPREFFDLGEERKTIGEAPQVKF